MDEAVRKLARKRASFCSIFGNTRRVLIAWTLGEDEMSVGDIAKTLDISLQNTSQHLRLMKDKGILSARRDGKTIFYRIAENELTDSCPIMLHTQYSEPLNKEPKND
ncbi:MAG: helix-turn-helix transcriptional regulator [Chloroflexi bacterium]|nr:helix-turn-helix transcriptional regulator [Chloroflexota bacterium]